MLCATTARLSFHDSYFTLRVVRDISRGLVGHANNLFIASASARRLGFTFCPSAIYDLGLALLWKKGRDVCCKRLGGGRGSWMRQ